jgi:glucan phosphorylase
MKHGAMEQRITGMLAGVPDPAIAVGSTPYDAEIESTKSALLAKLVSAVGRNPANATDRDWFLATALTVRDRVVFHWIESNRRTRIENRKRVYYLSLEFLIGRLLRDVLHNLGVTETYRAALGDLGVDLEKLRLAEPDAALGNGGLGRLAACFMESMATLSIAAWGYGIRYDHGLFRQVIKNGEQQEYPRTGCPLAILGSLNDLKRFSMSISAGRSRQSRHMAASFGTSGIRARRSRRWLMIPRWSAGAASM